MAKAERSGSYRVNGNEFVVKVGDVLPDDAEMVAEATTDTPEERAQPAAPENKARQPVPENRAAKQGA